MRLLLKFKLKNSKNYLYFKTFVNALLYLHGEQNLNLNQAFTYWHKSPSWNVILNLFGYLIRNFLYITDKQQELDLPTVKVEEPQGKKKEEEPADKQKGPMTQIIGVRKIKHANSFTGIVPQFGVEPTNADLLSQVWFSLESSMVF